MTQKKEVLARQSKDKKLKLKRQTIKDLDTRNRADKIKGGLKDPSMGCPQR